MWYITNGIWGKSRLQATGASAAATNGCPGGRKNLLCALNANHLTGIGRGRRSYSGTLSELCEIDSMRRFLGFIGTLLTLGLYCYNNYIILVRGIIGDKNDKIY